MDKVYKVICVNAGKKKLTNGKEYSVISDYSDYYEVINDEESEGTYFKSRFKVIPNCVVALI